MKRVFGIVLIIAGVALGLYVGAWLLFCKPILSCCGAFDTGTLTALKVGIAIIKCFFAGPVFAVIAYAGFILGATISSK